MGKFQLCADFDPKGDQPGAIRDLVENVRSDVDHQVLLGVTGSGKTFTIANVIEAIQKPTLVISPNKTLAAQLFNEFRTFFPQSAVEYFVSYYDYYQPEAYIPSTDTYIEKDATINDEIDKMRHSATRSLLERRDVIIVASVSCIYGLGSPDVYHGMMVYLREGDLIDRDDVIRQLVRCQYRRNDIEFGRGMFRVRGDVLEILPAHERDRAIRVEFFGDEVEAISKIDPLRGTVIEREEEVTIYPSSHYVTPEDRLRQAIERIERELEERLASFQREGKLLEAQRLEQRTRFDLEMLREVGFCQGIENYSRHLDGREAGVPPATLLEYFPDDSLIVVDESHITVPQIRGMYHGDQSRKRTLVEYGFRLPSALDNRPLSFEEFEQHARRVVFVSATPAEYELKKSGGLVVEQVIRPTGLMDPAIEVRPVKGQVDDLLHEIRLRAERGERTLVTTLTKRFAEDLTEHYQEMGVKVQYLHSDVETIDRVRIIRELRLGKYDAIVGINLLREGLDIPEVSLVAILDADKEGYLRSETSLIQTAGRTARNVSGKVIMYALRVTRSMQAAIDETDRRRAIQMEYNQKHGITPESVRKSINEILGSVYEMDYVTVPMVAEEAEVYESEEELDQHIARLEEEMRAAARELAFERAAALRDRIKALRGRHLELTLQPAFLTSDRNEETRAGSAPQ